MFSEVQASNNAAKIEALLEGSQQLYTKYATSKELVFIQRRNGYHTRENLVTMIPVDLYQFIAYLITLHRPIKGGQFFKAITSTYFALHPNLLSTIDLLRQYYECGSRLPRDSKLLQLNVFNQLLSLQLMEMIEPKAI